MKQSTNLFGALALVVVTLTWSQTSAEAPADEQIREAEELTVKYKQFYAEGKYDDANLLIARAVKRGVRDLG